MQTYILIIDNYIDKMYVIPEDMKALSHPSIDIKALDSLKIILSTVFMTFINIPLYLWIYVVDTYTFKNKLLSPRNFRLAPRCSWDLRFATSQKSENLLSSLYNWALIETYRYESRTNNICKYFPQENS